MSRSPLAFVNSMTISYTNDNMIREAVKTLQSIVTTKPLHMNGWELGIQLTKQ